MFIPVTLNLLVPAVYWQTDKIPHNEYVMTAIHSSLLGGKIWNLYPPPVMNVSTLYVFWLANRDMSQFHVQKSNDPLATYM